VSALRHTALRRLIALFGGLTLTVLMLDGASEPAPTIAVLVLLLVSTAAVAVLLRMLVPRRAPHGR